MQKFGKTFEVPLTIAVMLIVGMFSTVWAQQGPFGIIRNLGKTIESDPNKEYRLTESEGPYLILATALSGDTARQDAYALVLELRSRYKWNAYVFEKNFIRDAKQDFGQTQNPQIRTKIKYNNQEPKTEFAVVIGNFPSLEDNQFKKTLEAVRKCQPESLKGKKSAAAFSFPMAFGLENPMLPSQQKTVDAFITSLNINLPYTLLHNPRRYTVQIATFTGRAVVKPEDIRDIEAGKIPFEQEESALKMGAQAAATLCQTLRERGVEAYEFHDRYASIVTIGSFDQPGRKMPDSTIVPDPQIQQIIQQYKGQVINGIQCSSQPRLIDVPRAYHR